MRRRNWLWLLLLPLAWLAAYEPHEVVVHTAPPLEVRANEHAAASRLLAQWGLESRRILTPGALFPLPDHDTLLILKSNRGALNEGQARQLRAWVADGGRLLVTARPLPRGRNQQEATEQIRRDNDPLLYPLGVTSWHTRAPEPDPSAPELVERYLDAGTLFQRLCINASAEMKKECEDVMCRHRRPWHDSILERNGHRYRLGLDAGLEIRHPHLDNEAPSPGPAQPVASKLRYQAGNEWGQQLVSLTLGNGELLVVTSLDIWNNEQLHLLDHAWLLRQAGDEKARVWFVQNLDMPSLGRWLWERAWPLILGLLVVLALFLWRHIPRQGTLLSPQTGRQRDFLEHLVAASRFLWRTGNRRELLAALRRQVEKRLAAHPLPADSQARLSYLARYADMDQARIERALYQPPQNREQLIEWIATLQLLRSRL